MYKKIIFALSAYFLFSIFYFLSHLYAQPLEPEMTPIGVKFSYEDPEAGGVTLAGEFNNWDMKKNPLKKDEKGLWSTILPLKEGKYEYKFIIDGDWMPGANLVLEVKKDKQTGKLFIPAPKPGILTAYTGKIRFSGKYVGILPAEFTERSIIHMSSPINHIDFDWYITPTKETDAFVRLELDTLYQPLNLKFKKGYMDFHPTEQYLLKLYYNYKFIQFDNPLKILDQRGYQVGLRYEDLYFFDELNKHKAYGLDTQGLFFQAKPLGFKFNAFYANFQSLPQDDLGFRVISPPELGPAKFALTYFANRGVPWIYDVNADGWFPDPQYTVNRSTFGSSQPWYKGFIYKNFISADMVFRVSKLMEEIKPMAEVLLFTEYGISSNKLIAHRWNEAAYKDSPIDKSWPIENSTIFLGGIKTKLFEKFNLEISYQKTSGKFQQTISTDMTKVEFEEDYKGYDFGSSITKLIYRFDAPKYAFGFAASYQKNDDFDAVIDAELSPYLKSIIYSGKVYYIFKDDIVITPLIKLNLNNKAKVKLFADIHNAKLFPLDKTSLPTTIVKHTNSTVDYKWYEAQLDWSYNILPQWFLESNMRYTFYRYRVEKQNDFFAMYFSVAYHLKKNLLIRVGYGLDPEGLDEDLLDDFDRREEFLYNNYLANRSIVDAEKSLRDLQMLSVRVEIRF